MTIRTIAVIALGALALSAGGCATTASQTGGGPTDMRSIFGPNPAKTGAELDRAVVAADQHPLGSPQNPVRVSAPQGQRAYLDRLRCADGRAPSYVRRGNVGFGVFGGIVDDYAVTCAGQAAVSIQMDMYHPTHRETRTVPGFTLVR